MRNKFLFILVGGVILIFLYFGWKFYQNTTRTVIPTDDLEMVTLKEENNQLFLVGSAKLSQFEKVSNYGAVQIDDILYIYIMKTKALIKSDSVNENISKITVSDSSEPPKKIYLISGGNIEVKYKDNPEMNYMDVTRYSEKRELSK
jgi:hypothetical protein